MTIFMMTICIAKAETTYDTRIFAIQAMTKVQLRPTTTMTLLPKTDVLETPMKSEKNSENHIKKP